MAGQGIERRLIVRFIGLASVAGTFPGFHRWAFACSHVMPEANAEQTVKLPYRLLFFSPQQFKLVEHLAEMIIPADDTPGAREAGVAEFIDFMVANRVAVNGSDEFSQNLAAGTAAQGHFLAGLGWLDAHCRSAYGQEFIGCSPEQQISLLQEIAYKEKYKPATETGREFFQLIRDYTVVGYYTTKIGLESLGYPGLRTAWPKMPGCSHPENPEHAHHQEPLPANLAAFNIGK
jgi:gluconate 2-dehydrogenase gamma chain